MYTFFSKAENAVENLLLKKNLSFKNFLALNLKKNVAKVNIHPHPSTEGKYVLIQIFHEYLLAKHRELIAMNKGDMVPLLFNSV